VSGKRQVIGDELGQLLLCARPEVHQ
jgi:hypothetical protein